MRRSAWPDPVHRDPVFVQLLSGFRVNIGHREVVLPAHAQRVLAYLALSRPSGTSQHRTTLAERLWGECPHQRAQASLRTSIWRIRQADDRLVHADRGHVYLGALVEVDVQQSLEQAGRLLAGDGALGPGDAKITGLVADLLPGWKRIGSCWNGSGSAKCGSMPLRLWLARQCRLGQLIPALNAVYAAIAAEPLRESAHAALVEIHLAEGNIVEARKQVDKYARLLWDEMRLTPSDALVARVPGAADGFGRVPLHGRPPSVWTAARDPALQATHTAGER